MPHLNLVANGDVCVLAWGDNAGRRVAELGKFEHEVTWFCAHGAVKNLAMIIGCTGEVLSRDHVSCLWWDPEGFAIKLRGVKFEALFRVIDAIVGVIASNEIANVLGIIAAALPNPVAVPPRPPRRAARRDIHDEPRYLRGGTKIRHKGPFDDYMFATVSAGEHSNGIRTLGNGSRVMLPGQLSRLAIKHHMSHNPETEWDPELWTECEVNVAPGRWIKATEVSDDD